MTVFEEQFPTLTKERSINRFNETLTYILRNYTVFLLSFNHINMNNAKIEAPRVGICSNALHMKRSHITTTGKGCESDDGFGKGKRLDGCAGTGASHGGAGGYGGIEDDSDDEQKKCKNNKPAAYYSGKSIKYEGSGGASGTDDARLGGSGGGIIMINTHGTTNIEQSHIEANGGDATPMDMAVGSGGGSGGAIQLVTRNLKGTGNFEAKGGNGSQGGGGGGSGGRFVINFLHGHVASAQPH